MLEGEKYKGIYKMKEENSVRGGVSGISLKGSLSRGGASRKTATGYELGQSVAKKKKRCIQTRPEMVQAMAVNPFKGPRRGARTKSFTVRLQSRKESM